MEAGQGLWSKGAIDYGTVKHSMLSLISLTFDDGFRCQFDQALPVLKTHGIPATFFLIANQEPTHEGRKNEWWEIDWRDEDLAMLKNAVQEGHEIGSPSVTHDETTMPKQPEFEARESKRRIESWRGTEISSFCYPYYHSPLYLGDAVRNAGYKQVRRGGAKFLLCFVRSRGFQPRLSPGLEARRREGVDQTRPLACPDVSWNWR